MAPLSWQSIANYLGTQKPGYALRVASHRVEHPLDAGLQPTVALPVGQRGDYRTPIQGGRTLHVYDFDRYYVAILESPRLPSAPLPQDTERDANGVSTGVTLGGLLGLFLGRTAGAAVVGGALGALLGAASNPENYRRGLSDEVSRPATASRVRKKPLTKSNPMSPGRTRERRKKQP